MRHLPLLLLLFAFLHAPVRAADSLATEVNRLLAAVEGSGCTFVRNGSDHSSAAAAAHMREKFDYFRDQIRTPEDFIRLCCTKSETTGRPYLIRCGNTMPIPATDWLTRELARKRQGADDEYVKKAKSLSAQQFDSALPDQPMDSWLRSNIPVRYEVVWGEHITDCGEGTGTAADKERDLPLCAEVELKEGSVLTGYLALFVGTQKRGLLKDGYGLYFGYLDHHGAKHNFKRLSDVLKVK
jgi:hypothetical protein